MAIVESTPRRLVLQAGSPLSRTVLTLDKAEGCARVERSILVWSRRSQEISLSEVEEVSVVAVKDGVSGAEVLMPLMRLRSGEAVALPTSEAEAVKTADRVREFLGLAA